MCSVALWTCATDAEARGISSNDLKIFSSGFLVAFCICLIAILLSKAGTLSCNLAISLIASGGSISARIDSACPNFINIGPSFLKLLLVVHHA